MTEIENEPAGNSDPQPSNVESPAQRRLTELLRATTSIVERLDLEVVLRRIVEAGMSLVGARYGALGVISPNGRLERFIHVGVDATTADRIGHLPTGQGVLGAVIADRAPIRLEHLSDDLRSVGFPDHHPAMDSFLGVPVRVGDQVYGNLYLTQGQNGGFTVEDQELIVALAATAGIAIENARLYDVARTNEAWSATIADVLGAMMDVTGDDILDVIAERVAGLIEADLVAVAVPQGSDAFLLTTVHGRTERPLGGTVYPASGTLMARAIASRKAVSVSEVDEASVFASESGLGPTVAIPLFVGDEALGVLMVSRRLNTAAFTEAELEMAFTFAAQASIALEVVRAREDRRRLETTLDRSRIARDLHDHVIQRLYGAGLSLQAVSAQADSSVSEAIGTQLDVIDSTIKDIRTIIFALGAGERRGAQRVRDRLLDVVSEVAGGWPTAPRISFGGALDSLTTPDLADDLVAVLRELLTNAAKHAQARSVTVAVAIVDENVELEVADDGVGMPRTATRSGLNNIVKRAALRGGDCAVVSALGDGTTVSWRVPIDELRGKAS